MHPSEKRELIIGNLISSIIIVAIVICVFTVVVSLSNKKTASADASATTDATDAFSVGLSPSRNYLIVVNDQKEYNFNGPYDDALHGDLIYVADVYGEPTPVEKGAFLAFNMLQQNLRDQGVEIGLFSAYRTKEDQQAVYDYYSTLEGWAENNKVSKPGFSEHHTGLLLSILIWGEDEDGKMVWMTETAERQAGHPEFRVVHQTLADFGFIDRYPAGKEKITGVPCEPYEIRFVGSSHVAHKIMDNGLCLEEYVSSK